jgi:hypothetical protein
MVREALIPVYEEQAEGLLSDPWAARDDYIRVILDRSDESLDSFFSDHAATDLDEDSRARALKLLEMQRHAMLMYTSCGWFFDEISGIETTQVMGYAARAIQLAKDAADIDLENEFRKMLAKAPSNIPRYGTGGVVFDRLVKPAYLDLVRVGAHFAIASLFEADPEDIRIYCYHQEGLTHESREAGAMRLSAGIADIVSDVTRESNRMGFAAVYLGGHNAVCGITRDMDPLAHKAALKDLGEAFDKSDIPELIRTLDKHFESSGYSLWHLFKDEQRKVVDEILAQPLESLESAFNLEVERNYTLLRFLSEIGQPLPRAFARAAEIAVNAEFKRAFEHDRPDPEQIAYLCEQAERLGVPLEGERLELMAGTRVTGFMQEMAKNPCQVELLEYLRALVNACNQLPVQMVFWQAQNIYFRIGLRGHEKSLPDDERACRDSERYQKAFAALGEALGVRVE